MVANNNNISILQKNLFTVILLLTAFGTVVMYSASSIMSQNNFDSNTHFLYRHLIWLLIGFILAVVSYVIPINGIKKYSKFILLLGVIIIIAGIILNPTSDASRWIIYKNSAKQITTSDFGRLALIIYTARFLDKYEKKINDFKNVLFPFLVTIGILLLAIISQPDFSTTVVLSCILFLMLFIGGVNLNYLGGIILVTIPLGIYKIFTNPYMRKRLLGFINNDADNSALNTVNDQVSIAIMSMGSAGIFGRGLGDGLLKKGFLPEVQTDFVFSVIGEEFGLISEFIVLFAFFYLFLKGLKLAQKAPDLFSMFLVLGISINFIIYTIINVAYVVKLLPTTGLALPFISYGGTHTMVNFIMVGLLFNVSREIEKHGF